jgi:hypothetical protein
MMTLVAEKKVGDWLVIVGQNTNAILGVPLNFTALRHLSPFPGRCRNLSYSSLSFTLSYDFQPHRSHLNCSSGLPLVAVPPHFGHFIVHTATSFVD